MKATRTITLALALFATLAPAAQVDLHKASSKVEFVAKTHPGSLHIRGKTPDEHALDGKLAVTDDTLQGEASFALDNLDTGIALRTRHMKENYLETKQHPTATIVLPALKLVAGGGKQPFQGKLKLHGQEKPVEGTVQVTRQEGALGASFSFPIKLSDFAIKQPSFMGISVDETVEVQVEVAGPLDAS
jgi:polyisoprenoid-binding protein YceI